jgi:hypothetical protein
MHIIQRGVELSCEHGNETLSFINEREVIDENPHRTYWSSSNVLDFLGHRIPCLGLFEAYINPSRKTRGYYLDYVTIASFQILSYSLFINRIIRRCVVSIQTAPLKLRLNHVPPLKNNLFGMKFHLAR